MPFADNKLEALDAIEEALNVRMGLEMAAMAILDPDQRGAIVQLTACIEEKLQVVKAAIRAVRAS